MFLRPTCIVSTFCALTTAVLLSLLSAPTHGQDVRPDAPITQPSTSTTSDNPWCNGEWRKLSQKVDEIDKLRSPHREHAKIQWNTCVELLFEFCEAHEKYRNACIVYAMTLQDERDSSQRDELGKAAQQAKTQYFNALRFLEHLITLGKLRGPIEPVESDTTPPTKQPPTDAPTDPLPPGKPPADAPTWLKSLYEQFTKLPHFAQENIDPLLDTTIKAFAAYNAAKQAFERTKSQQRESNDRGGVKRLRELAALQLWDLARLNAELNRLRRQLQRAVSSAIRKGK